MWNEYHFETQRDGRVRSKQSKQSKQSMQSGAKGHGNTPVPSILHIALIKQCPYLSCTLTFQLPFENYWNFV